MLLAYFFISLPRGHGDMVLRLLHMGAIDTINHADAGGWTALHYVAAYCEPEYVEVWLLRYGFVCLICVLLCLFDSWLVCLFICLLV